MMIKKLRWKFIGVMMSIVMVFLLAIFMSMYHSTLKDLERISLMTLNNAADRQFISGNPGRDRKHGLFAQEPMLPVAVATKDQDGQITLLENQMFYLTADEIIQVVEGMENQKDPSGELTSYQLRYIQRELEQGKIGYVFVDISVERKALGMLAMNSLGLAACMAGLFFVASLLLARWMVRPVENAWNEQRQFVADASHELKTPLTVVLSNADMMIQANAVTDEKNIRRLDNIKAESQRIKGLVEDLLILAKADSKKDTKVYSEISISAIATYSILTMEPTIFDAGRMIDSQIQEGLEVMGDGEKLRQLMDILLDNACKYSNEGSIIQVSLGEIGKKEILLSVTSESTPIPTDEQEAIFRRFYRADQSRGKEVGYGLGLSIAQTIVSDHGGKIGVRSEGKSNTFFVQLPRA